MIPIPPFTHFRVLSWRDLSIRESRLFCLINFFMALHLSSNDDDVAPQSPLDLALFGSREGFVLEAFFYGIFLFHLDLFMV